MCTKKTKTAHYDDDHVFSAAYYAANYINAAPACYALRICIAHIYICRWGHFIIIKLYIISIRVGYVGCPKHVVYHQPHLISRLCRQVMQPTMRCELYEQFVFLEYLLMAYYNADNM